MQLSSEKVKRIAEFGRTLSRDRDIPEIEKIAGLFPRGFNSIVASMAGTGKTWLTEYIACQLSCGGRILGGMVAKSPKYKTVIMSGETGADLLDLRLQGTNWEHNEAYTRVYSAVDMALNEIPCMINTKEGQETVIAICANEKPDIIFFDTLISFHTADESKQADMTAIYTFLLRIAKAFNCAVVVNHHTRKRPANLTGRKFTQEDIIGSSVGARLCSAAFVIMAEDDEQGGSKMLVHNVKNWGKKVPDFTYEFIEDEAGLTDFRISFDSTQKNLYWSLRERFTELLKSYEAGSMLKVADIARELGVSSENIRYYVDEATKTGRLVRVKIIGETAYKVQEE